MGGVLGKNGRSYSFINRTENLQSESQSVHTKIQELMNAIYNKGRAEPDIT